MHTLAHGTGTPPAECRALPWRARITLGWFALLAALVTAPVAAQAQVNPFRGLRGPTLTQPDITAGRAAAARLLGANPKPAGSVEEWANPASGNAGTLTVERAYRRAGRDCRDVRSSVNYSNGAERSLLFRACRVGGQWRLAD